MHKENERYYKTNKSIILLDGSRFCGTRRRIFSSIVVHLEVESVSLLSSPYSCRTSGIGELIGISGMPIITPSLLYALCLAVGRA